MSVLGGVGAATIWVLFLADLFIGAAVMVRDRGAIVIFRGAMLGSMDQAVRVPTAWQGSTRVKTNSPDMHAIIVRLVNIKVQGAHLAAGRAGPECTNRVVVRAAAHTARLGSTKAQTGLVTAMHVSSKQHS